MEMVKCKLNSCETTLSKGYPDYCPLHNNLNTDSQDVLWKEVHKIILDSGDVYAYDRDGAIEKLKYKFKITQHGMDKRC